MKTDLDLSVRMNAAVERKDRVTAQEIIIEAIRANYGISYDDLQHLLGVDGWGRGTVMLMGEVNHLKNKNAIRALNVPVAINTERYCIPERENTHIVDDS